MSKPTSERISKTSIIALVAAILSFTSGAFWAWILAGVAILFGILGVLKSMSDKVRGGIISTISILAGALGVLVAIVKTILHFT